MAEAKWYVVHTYSGYENYMYFMEKRLVNGHYVCLEFVSNPDSPDAVICIGHRITLSAQTQVDGLSP